MCDACGWHPSAEIDSSTDTAHERSAAALHDQAGELRPVTALFADVVGSTALAEHLDPHEVRLLIGDCVNRMTAIIEAFGGSVGAYVGDGIAAFFGLDSLHEDDPRRACLAALEIQKALHAYRHEVEEAWGIEKFAVRIGINAGRAAVGAIGAADPRSIALGDAVNVAARLQSLAVPGSILVGPTIARECARWFRMETVGDLRLKGLARSIEGWRLLGAVTSAPSSAVPTYGRAAEIARLDEIASELSEGRGQALVISGEAGIGKSRMVRELRRMLRDSVTWLEGHARTAGMAPPYAPVAQMLEAWFGIRGSTSPVEARLRVRSLCRQSFGSDQSQTAAYLSRLVGVDLDPGPTPAGLGESEKLPVADAVERACYDWLLRLSALRPVVLVFEDVHEYSDSLARLISSLLPIAERRPVLFLLTSRTESGVREQRIRTLPLTHLANRTAEIHLRGLERNACDALVRALDPSATWQQQEVDELVVRSNQNPLFIEELVAAGRGDGVAGRWERVDVPLSIELLLMSRVIGLPDHVREVLEVAAVMGSGFLLEELAASLDQTPDQVAESLWTLARQDLIRESWDGRRPRFVFKHVLLEGVVQASVPGARLKAIHRRVARALLRCGGEPARLAHHFARSGEAARAASSSEEAGRRAMSVGAWEEARELLVRARELALQVGCLEVADRAAHEQVVCEFRLGRKDQAVRLLNDVEATVEVEHGRSRLRLAAARALNATGDWEATLEILSGEEKEELPAELAAAGLDCRAEAMLRLGRHKELRAELGKLNAYVDSSLPPELAFRRGRAWAALLCEEGDHTEALRWVERCRETARETGIELHKVTAEADCGLMQLLMGHTRLARETLEYAYEEGVKNGFGELVDRVGNNLMYLRLTMGELRGTLALEGELHTPLQPPFWRFSIASITATALLESGLVDEARAKVSECRRLLGTSEQASTSSIGLDVLDGAIHALEGDNEGATVILRAAHSQATKLDGRYDLQVLASYWLAVVALEEGRIAEALKLAEDSVSAARKSERGLMVSALQILGRAREAVLPGSGIEDLRAALAMAREAAMDLEAARCLIHLAQTEVPEGDLLLEEARTSLERCGAWGDLERLGHAYPSRGGAAHLPDEQGLSWPRS
ncbi:MAG TPA: adenylate/guanylate cyclase domain-containing protein [Actinomycetota bacterium]|nr:adenylate/guanylate cyclase domain-containing protein [Actinomycetota bacterium]